jgi:hypothetical protein
MSRKSLKRIKSKQKQQRRRQQLKKKHQKGHMQTKPTPLNTFQSSDARHIQEFSKLSISQESLEAKAYAMMDSSLNSDPTLMLVNYLTMPQINFKEALLSLTSNDIDTQQLVQMISDNEDIYLFIQLINQFNYLQLQIQQWNYYNELGLTQGIWHGRVSKKMANVHSMCLAYGRTKTLIQQRLQKYKEQLEYVRNEIDQYVNKVSSDNKNDMNKITYVINNLIYQDQYPLRIELERRRHMLQFDAKEHQLVNDLYQLKPRKSGMIIIYHKSGHHRCIPKSHPHLWIMKSKKIKTGNQVGILI